MEMETTARHLNRKMIETLCLFELSRAYTAGLTSWAPEALCICVMWINKISPPGNLRNQRASVHLK